MFKGVVSFMIAEMKSGLKGQFDGVKSRLTCIGTRLSSTYGRSPELNK